MKERLDRFMARANAAYYAGHDPFRDFVTAPELSQVFGELLGLWCSVVWRMMGQPAPFGLIEAGPGRGTMMRDALRAVERAMPAFATACRLHFIETSPRLIPLLREVWPEAACHSDFSSLPAEPIILLANEFFDALPIRQFVRQPAGWAERYVQDGAFVLEPSDRVLPDEPPGTVRECGDTAADITTGLADHIHRHGGAALVIDYGPQHGAPGETLQAIRDGRFADPLRMAGSGDLTAHVDFERLATCATRAGCLVAGPVSQGRFLTSLGIHERTAQLGRSAAPAAAAALLAATRRLVLPEAMGSLFKVMAITHPNLPEPPGFAA